MLTIFTKVSFGERHFSLPLALFTGFVVVKCSIFQIFVFWCWQRVRTCVLYDVKFTLVANFCMQNDLDSLLPSLLVSAQYYGNKNTSPKCKVHHTATKNAIWKFFYVIILCFTVDLCCTYRRDLKPWNPIHIICVNESECIWIALAQSTANHEPKSVLWDSCNFVVMKLSGEHE